MLPVGISFPFTLPCWFPLPWALPFRLPFVSGLPLWLLSKSTYDA